MSRSARVLSFVAAALVATASTVSAQPNILAVLSPPPNERGWNNSPVEVEFICAQASKCPEEEFLTQEGATQILEVTALGRDQATTVTETVTLNLDWTAPLVTIQSPARAIVTAAASITVTARTTDAVSQPRAATCNGRAARIDDDGMIRCDVPLLIGANDVVVEVSDYADNSGSAGIRIIRTGEPQLTIVPEEIGMIVGQVTTVQVQDEAGRAAQRVVWRVNNPSAGEISTDGRHVFSARAPGVVTITASVGKVEATARVTVYAGDRLPVSSTRWKVGALLVVQTPDTQPLKPSPRNLVATGQKPGEPAYILSVNSSTGWQNWRARPASNPTETPEGLREMAGNDAVLVYDSKETGRSAIVHSATGQPWRYQSAGRIRPMMIVSKDNHVMAMETSETGFTRLLVMDGADGRVFSRVPLPSGVGLQLNQDCVKGHHGIRYIPSQVGPFNNDGRGLNFGIVLFDDHEDFGICGTVSGTYKRTVAIVTIDDAKRIANVATVEIPVGGAVPAFELFEVTVDRLGAKLLPWALRNPAAGSVDYRITRLTADGNSKEYSVPGAGKIWLSGREDDLAVTTDGTRLIGFNVVTGAIIISQTYPAGVKIMSVDHGQVLHSSGNTLSRSDLPIQR